MGKVGHKVAKSNKDVRFEILKSYLAGAAVRPLLLVRFAAFQQGSIFNLPQF